MTTTQQKNDWIAQKTERIYLLVPKGKKDRIQAEADKRFSGSINAYINNLISRDLNMENNWN